MSALGRGIAALFLIIPLLACNQTTSDQGDKASMHQEPTSAAPAVKSNTAPEPVPEPVPEPEPVPAQTETHHDHTPAPQPVEAAAAAEPADYIEGTHYQIINPPQPTQNSDKVEVTEVFWYGCPHCFHLEPATISWLKHKPANVDFIRLPAPLNKNWELLSAAYYAAEDLGVVEKIHEPMFKAIHETHTKLNTEQDVITFFVAHGVKEDDIRNAISSFSVLTKVRRAQQLGERYGLTGVPAVIVNGKYRTDVSMAGGIDAVYKVVDFLIRKESAVANGK